MPIFSKKNTEKYLIFFYQRPWNRICISNTDTDPGDKIECGSGSEILPLTSIPDVLTVSFSSVLSGHPVLAILSRLSCPGCPVPAVLSWQYCHFGPATAVMPR
jgi:hypothetical protein